MTARTAGLLTVAGVVGWAGWLVLATRMLSTSPPTAGFDLDLLIQAGRDVAAGRSPYDPAILGGSAPIAENLFYSYPPVVAQAMALVAGLPAAAIFLVWDVLAVVGFAAISAAIWRTVRGTAGLDAAAAAIALTPFVAPFAIGLLFGNLDVFFPLLYGAVLLAWMRGTSRGTAILGGSALVVASVSKLHPALLGLTTLASVRSSRSGLQIVAVAIVGLAAILAVSLLAGGAPLWTDYMQVLRASAASPVVDPRNAGPAAQIALLISGPGSSGEALARALQYGITGLAIVAAVIVGIRSSRPVERFAVAATASLVVLPVTWFHYPSALLPVAVAVLASPMTQDDRRSRAAIAIAGICASLALFWLPLLYVSVALIVVAARLAVAESGERRPLAERRTDLPTASVGRRELGDRRPTAAIEESR